MPFLADAEPAFDYDAHVARLMAQCDGGADEEWEDDEDEDIWGAEGGAAAAAAKRRAAGIASSFEDEEAEVRLLSALQGHVHPSPKNLSLTTVSTNQIAPFVV